MGRITASVQEHNHNLVELMGKGIRTESRISTEIQGAREQGGTRCEGPENKQDFYTSNRNLS